MKITMYELLGMVKDGKAPKKIKYKGHIYQYQYKDIRETNIINYYHSEEIHHHLIDGGWHDIRLNDEVEILEEEKKIPEKLNLYYHINNDVEEETGETTFNDLCDIIGNLRKHEDTINSIIDYLKSKGE